MVKKTKETKKAKTAAKKTPIKKVSTAKKVAPMKVAAKKTPIKKFLQLKGLPQ